MQGEWCKLNAGYSISNGWVHTFGICYALGIQCMCKLLSAVKLYRAKVKCVSAVDFGSRAKVQYIGSIASTN